MRVNAHSALREWQRLNTVEEMKCARRGRRFIRKIAVESEEAGEFRDNNMDAMNLLGLTCAVLAALACGVLLAYSCCQALFALLRMHSRSLHPGNKAMAQAKPVEPQVQVS